MNIKTLNEKIAKVKALQAQNLYDIGKIKTNMAALQNDIKTIEQSKNSKGEEVKQLIKSLNKNKILLRSNKRALRDKEWEAKFGFSGRLQRYERMKRKLSLFDWLEDKRSKVNENPSV